MKRLTSLTFTGPMRKYDIRFKRGTTVLIRGDSAVGKSLLCWEVFHSKGVEPDLDSVYVVDAESAYGLDLAAIFADSGLYEKYSMFVIDNADLLVTDRVSEAIREHLDSHWIFIGRRLPACMPDVSCVGELRERNGVVVVDYV